MPDKQLLLEFALDTYDRITSLVASLDDDTAHAPEPRKHVGE